MFLLLISTPVSLNSALSPGTDISPGRPPQNNIFPAQVWNRRQNRKLVQHRTQVSAFLQSIWRNVNWNSNNKLVFKRLLNICFPLRMTYISHTMTSGKKLVCVQVTWLYVSSSWSDDDWERVALSSTGTAAKMKHSLGDSTLNTAVTAASLMCFLTSQILSSEMLIHLQSLDCITISLCTLPTGFLHDFFKQ